MNGRAARENSAPPRRVRAGEGLARWRAPARRFLPAAVGAALLSACSGPQSALDPAGHEAALLANLFWIMLIGAVLIWFVVVGFAVYAARIRPGEDPPIVGNALIIGGGIVFPVVTLAVLLAYGLWLMPELREAGDGPRIAVTGERWWWRVTYRPDEAAGAVESANEVRLPVGRRAEILLDARHIIHSFWIPALAGKMDMFPGRRTSLILEPTRTGIFRGQCAEFCGTSHALMAFTVVVMEEDDYAAWLAREAAPAALAAPEIARGRDLFLASGCGACHSVRGTGADGDVGPDLTHLAGRATIAAGTLPNDLESLVPWIQNARRFKPDANMPPYLILSDDELRALALYLTSLK